jgi:hypothetical protein
MRFYISYTWWDKEKESETINKWLFNFLENNPIKYLFVYGTEIKNFKIQFKNEKYFEINFSAKKCKNYPYITHLISDNFLYDNGILRALSESGKEDYLVSDLTPINEFIANDTINELHLNSYFSETYKKRKTNPFLDSWDRLVNAEL